jgi:DNA-binding HxlR family transcriptional regulator
MSMKQYAGKIKLLTDTPFGYTLTMIGGKWRLIILYWLVEHEAVRYNELQRLIGTITPRTLSTQLKEMQADGLIIRTEHPQIPPKKVLVLSTTPARAAIRSS